MMIATGIAANTVGGVALLATAIALVRAHNRGLLWTMAGAVALWAVHYGLLGSLYGAVVHGIAALAILASIGLRHRRSDRRAFMAAALLFSLASLAPLVWITPSWANSLAAAGSVEMTLVEFLASGAVLRGGLIAGESLFFSFALLVGSVPGIAVTASNIIWGLVGLWRIHRARAHKRRVFSTQQGVTTP